MASAKLFLLFAILAVMSASSSAQILRYIYPQILAEFYRFIPTEQGYSFELEEPNGSKREEMGFIMNPGTENEEMVVMGTFSSYDEKSGIETTTVYTADKNGYRPRVMLKNRKLSPGALKSAAG